MSEATFPLLGTAIVFLVVLPACALSVKICLLAAERTPGPLHNLTLRYLLLTGSSVLPLAWLVSAGLHQAESGKSAIACLLDHGAAGSCLESGYFALALGLATLASCLRAQHRSGLVRASGPENEQSLRQRIDRVILGFPALAVLKGRVLVTSDQSFAIGTLGLLRPRVVIGAHFADLISDEMLASAFAHEVAHVRALDPLRYWVLQLALAINPAGRFLLDAHADRWFAAREAHCDREAVIHGASPLSLANAIVSAARPRAQLAVALGPSDLSSLRFRVELLLAFAERAPTRRSTRGPSAFAVALALLLITLILPHQTSTKPLDALHAGAEHTVSYLSH